MNIKYILCMERRSMTKKVGNPKKKSSAPPLERKAFSLKETAQILGVSLPVVRNLQRIGKLKTVRLVERGNHLVPATEIERILAGGNG